MRIKIITSFVIRRRNHPIITHPMYLQEEVEQELMDTKDPVENNAQPPTLNEIGNPSCGQGSSVRNNTFEVLIEPDAIIHRLTIALKDAGCELRVMEKTKKVSSCGMHLKITSYNGIVIPH